MRDRDLLDQLEETAPVMIMIIRRHDGWGLHVRPQGEGPAPFHVANEKTIRGAVEALLYPDPDIEDLL